MSGSGKKRQSKQQKKVDPVPIAPEQPNGNISDIPAKESATGNPKKHEQQSLICLIFLPIVLPFLFWGRVYCYFTALTLQAWALFWQNEAILLARIKEGLSSLAGPQLKKNMETLRISLRQQITNWIAYGKVKVYDPLLKKKAEVYDRLNTSFGPAVAIVQNIYDFCLSIASRVLNFARQVWAFVVGILTTCHTTVLNYWQHYVSPSLEKLANLRKQVVAFLQDCVTLVRTLVRRVVSTTKGVWTDVVKPGCDTLLRTVATRTKDIRARIQDMRTRAVAIYTQSWLAAVIKTTVAQAQAILEVVQKQCTVVLQRLLALFQQVKARSQTEGSKAYKSAFDVLQSLPLLRRIKAD
jgi:hypothetical protein